MNHSPAVIFDFDGVIVDSLGSHLLAWDQACMDLYKQTIPEDIMRTLSGRSTMAIALILSEFFKKPSTAEQLANQKRDLLTKDLKFISLLPGVREYMSFLLKHQIPFGIASNAPRNFVRKLCEAHSLEVKIALGIEDASRPKPAPDLFLTCAAKLKVEIPLFEEILVYEDSTHGIEAACDASMIAVGVTTQHNATTLKQAGAKLTVSSLSDALNLRLGVDKNYLQPES